jgi:SET domain-containing protein
VTDNNMTDKTQDLEFVRTTTLNTINSTLIKKSCLHGFGLFATNAIHDGQILYLFDGQIVSIDDYKKIELLLAEQMGPYKNYIFMECNYVAENTLLVRNFRTKYSYINHSRAPNLEIRYHPMRLMAIQNIDHGEELTIDYRKENLPPDYLSKPSNRYL